jgi:DNA-binding transcriptional MerR regulator
MGENFIKTEEVAKLLSVSVATVNYYTNLGLFKVRDRSGNKRLYEKNEIRELHELIRKMRKEGYSLRIIQERLNTKGYRI